LPHHLQPVLVARVVTSRDHHAAVGVEVMHGKIEQRGGADADVDHVDARPREPLGQRLEEPRRRQATIASHCDGELFVLGPALDDCRGKSFASRPDEIAREFAIRDPPDVVFAENVRRN
jgi:hypothetical protein